MDTNKKFSRHHEFDVKHTEMLKQVRRDLSIARDDPIEELVVIDAIQRLGIEHHFVDAVKETLQRHYQRSLDHHDTQEPASLFVVSLRFRLFRQAGHAVSTGTFDRFKDDQGKFKQSLCSDIKGLMSLHEASQLSMEGEDSTLDEANALTRRLLSAWLDDNHDHHKAIVVKNALRHTYRNSIARFTSKDFLVSLQSINYAWGHALHDLSRVEFNELRSIHQKEVQQVTKWWRELGLRNEMKLIRDQPLKWYTWSLATVEDPKMSELRIELTKAISMVYVIDDIFDIYGTIDELTLFTEAVVGWDYTIVETLPAYMKACFHALDGITTEISDKVYKDHGWESIDSLRKTWAVLCRAFLVEAKWFAWGHLPGAEEYLKNGVISSGVHAVLIHVFFMLGQGLTDKSVNLVFNGNEGIIHSVATILRLWDDLGSAKDENQDGKDGSYVECYMKENEGMSVESAREHVHQRISDTWKRLNKESLRSNPFSPAFIKWAVLCRAFLVEAKWFASGHLPGAEEYLKNGVISSGVHAVLIHMFFMLGQGLTDKSVNLVFNGNEGIIHSVATILRLWDDLGSAKDENQDGKDGSYVECYMKENEGMSVESAREHVHQRISDTWKRLNKESLRSNPFSPAFIKVCLNAARMVPMMYSYDEDSHLPHLEQHMKSLLC